MPYCDRPLVQQVDFETARFVVSRASGLDIGGKHLELGEEVPHGVLGTDALRRVYEPPLRLIELAEYALTNPDLREACARKGILLEEPSCPDPQSQSSQSNSPGSESVDVLETMTKEDLSALCLKYGLEATGSKKQLRARLAALVG